MAYWDREKEVLYLLAQNSSNDEKFENLMIEIPSTISRGLFPTLLMKDLEDFIGRLLGKTKTMIEKIMDGRSSWNLPKYEIEWIEGIVNNPEPLDDTPADEPGDETEEEEEEVDNSGGGDNGKDEKDNGGKKRTPDKGLGGSRGKGGHTGSRGPGRSPNTHKNQSKFHSYVQTNPGDDEEQKEIARSENWTDPVNRAGMAIVIAYEKECKRHPIDMNKEKGENFPGYDVTSKETTNKEIERIIEVKSISGEWGQRGVTMSRTQFKAAQEYKNKYWLYIIEKVSDEHPQIIMI